MDQKRSFPNENNEGRDFVSSMAREKSKYERAQAIRPGDYITMDPKIFAQWSGSVLVGDIQILENTESIRVTVESVSYRDEAKTQPDKIVVISSSGVKKEVDASLFGSYGYITQDTKSFSVTDWGDRDINPDHHRNVG